MQDLKTFAMAALILGGMWLVGSGLLEILRLVTQALSVNLDLIVF